MNNERLKELAIRLLRKLIVIAGERKLQSSEIKYMKDAINILEKGISND
jgi:hypothetical protein